ncbi:MAG TPA: hypothetical protein P5210_05285 [Draconibacterium sp.]|nr:hypothetical protein [Draconibacterium sp.]
MNRPKTAEKKIPTKHKVVFNVITGLIPFLILLAFEGLLRLSGYGDNLDLFIRNSTEGYEKYMIVNPRVGKKYFQKFEYTAPANDIFLAEKPENTFRVFVMGSSTVYGFPYERNLMFSRILHQQLEDAYPDKKIEVVNTAITAINSFTLLDFSGQILKYEPDAILIYAGHNEFYGAFGIGSNETMSRNRDLTQLHITLMDYKIYQLLRNVIAGISQKIASGKNDEVHGTLMKRMVADKDILLNSDEYKIAMERYRQNMTDILEKFKKKNVPVFFSEMVSNVSGMEPFNSVSADGLEPANEVYKKAQKAEENGDFDNALELYYKAKDLDCIRFRASEEVNSIINELAEKYKTYKVPMLSWFQSNSPKKLIGNNLMTEHVHPNIYGIFLMAQAFRDEIEKSKIPGEPGISDISSEYYKRNWGYTELDSLIAHHRIQLLKGFWPFTNDETLGVNYRNGYRPKSYTDSLAFTAMKNADISLDEVRLDLARKYEKAGQIEKAYKEYEALVRTNPYLAVNYRDAANCLLQLSDLPLALKYFKKSLEYEESFFANYRIGEIYLLMGDYNSAIGSFEKSFSLAPDDKKVNVLAKSYTAFVYANKTNEAKAAAAELKRVNASQLLRIPPKTYVFEKYIPFQTRMQIEQAKQLIQENKTDEALNLLESSLNIYDSHIANRMIGEIYFSRNDFDKALFWFNKVYDKFKFDARFLDKIASVYLAKKDLPGARKYIEEIKNIDPQYENLEHLNMLLSSTN